MIIGSIFPNLYCSSHVVKKKKETQILEVDDTFIYASKQTIKKNLANKLNKYNREWEYKTINYTVDVLMFGERLYSIDHRIILNIMDIESNLDVKAKRKNKNGTWDKGICQVNDCNLPEYKKSAKILNKYNIWYTDASNRFDIGLNIISAYVYFNWSKDELNKQKEFTEERWIVSYNCGLNGSNAKDPKYNYLADKRQNYWNRYKEANL